MFTGSSFFSQGKTVRLRLVLFQLQCLTKSDPFSEHFTSEKKMNYIGSNCCNSLYNHICMTDHPSLCSNIEPIPASCVYMSLAEISEKFCLGFFMVSSYLFIINNGLNLFQNSCRLCHAVKQGWQAMTGIVPLSCAWPPYLH